MTTKDENIARIQVLAGILSRPADISGTAADIAQRVVEWQEEADALDDSGIAENPVTDNAEQHVDTGLALVTLCATVHLYALDDSGKEIETGIAGQRVQIPAALVDAFRDRKLIN